MTSFLWHQSSMYTVLEVDLAHVSHALVHVTSYRCYVDVTLNLLGLLVIYKSQSHKMNLILHTFTINSNLLLINPSSRFYGLIYRPVPV